jgi:hypothetical protein
LEDYAKEIKRLNIATAATGFGVRAKGRGVIEVIEVPFFRSKSRPLSGSSSLTAVLKWPSASQRLASDFSSVWAKKTDSFPSC